MIHGYQTIIPRDRCLGYFHLDPTLPGHVQIFSCQEYPRLPGFQKAGQYCPSSQTSLSARFPPIRRNDRRHCLGRFANWRVSQRVHLLPHLVDVICFETPPGDGFRLTDDKLFTRVDQRACSDPSQNHSSVRLRSAEQKSRVEL
jgi:hypothetical protein